MAKNLGHPCVVEKARLRKSESHNSSRLRDCHTLRRSESILAQDFVSIAFLGVVSP